MNGVVQKLLAMTVMVGGLALSSPAVLAQDNEQSANAVDTRTPVVLRPWEKTLVLNDMREYLKGLQAIFAALAKDDMATVSAKAREMGKINIYETYLNFPNRAGVKFRELSSLVHEDFENIADNAAKKDVKAVLFDLSQTMKRCTSCHESYRLTDMSHSR